MTRDRPILSVRVILLLNLKAMVNKVAKTEASVLITGENGTGKELVARSYTETVCLLNSLTLGVNCAAISETLMESEFLGMKKAHLLVQLREERAF